MKKYQNSRKTLKRATFLDANEAPSTPLSFFSILISVFKIKNLNKYPDIYQTELKKEFIKIFNNKFLTVENLLFSNGSIEMLDQILRAIKCKHVLIQKPSYSLYKHLAARNEKEASEIIYSNIVHVASKDEKQQLIILTSPNNPTGHMFKKKDLIKILDNANNFVVIDQAYIEYTNNPDRIIELIFEYENLVIVRTFSKAWGAAGLRFGYCFASKETIEIISNYSNPYGLNSFTTELVSKIIKRKDRLNKNVKQTMKNKDYLVSKLRKLGYKVTDTAANFILLESKQINKIVKQLHDDNVVIRKLEQTDTLKNTARITVGSHQSNKRLIKLLTKYG